MCNNPKLLLCLKLKRWDNVKSTSWGQRCVMTSQLSYDVTVILWRQCTSNIRHEGKVTSCRLRLRYDFKNTSWRQQKYVMTSTCASWCQQVWKVRHDVKNIVMTSIGYVVTSKIASWRWKFSVLYKMSNKRLIRLRFKNILALIWHWYDVSFPSYRRLCVFHNFGDLDLYLFPWYVSTMQVSYPAISM